MDNRRLILFLVFAISVGMLWDAWLKHNAPKAPDSAAAAAAAAVAPTPTLAVGGGVVPAVTSPAEAVTGKTVEVSTDLYRATVSAQGGDLIRLELLKHKANEDANSNFVLFDNGEKHVYQAQSGLIGGSQLPTHKTVFAMEDGPLRLADGEKSFTLRMTTEAGSGVQVAKTYTFHRGSYLIDVSYEISNQSSNAFTPFAYFQIARDSKAPEGESMMMATFTGPAIYTEEGKFQKIDFGDIADNSAKYVKKSNDGWVAMIQHYFVSAYLPRSGVEREYYTRKVGDDLYAAGVIVPFGEVAAGQKATLGVPLFAGPQETRVIEAVAPNFDLVVDYGWLTFLAKPLFWVLDWMYQLTGNWGWAIILLTLVIKAIFFPLSAAGYKSMAKMKTLGPRLQRLKEQYGDDRQKLQQAMMEMYKREKINPFGGCLPIAVQIPVFIALYWVLLAVVEMRHAPWIGWITDLTAQDPYFILPVLMGATMLLQTKLNPAPPDPMQAKLMTIMPIAFTAMFLFFPAGLVLYWTVSNIISIVQQWQINRMYAHIQKPANA